MDEEPLDIFYVNTTIRLSLWDRVKVLLGRRATVSLKLPVYTEAEDIGGLRGTAETTVSVPPLIRRRGLGGGYEKKQEPTP